METVTCVSVSVGCVLGRMLRLTALLLPQKKSRLDTAKVCGVARARKENVVCLLDIDDECVSNEECKSRFDVGDVLKQFRGLKKFKLLGN